MRGYASLVVLLLTLLSLPRKGWAEARVDVHLDPGRWSVRIEQQAPLEHVLAQDVSARLHAELTAAGYQVEAAGAAPSPEPGRALLATLRIAGSSPSSVTVFLALESPGTQPSLQQLVFSPAQPVSPGVLKILESVNSAALEISISEQTERARTKKRVLPKPPLVIERQPWYARRLSLGLGPALGVPTHRAIPVAEVLVRGAFQFTPWLGAELVSHFTPAPLRLEVDPEGFIEARLLGAELGVALVPLQLGAFSLRLGAGGGLLYAYSRPSGVAGQTDHALIAAASATLSGSLSLTDNLSIVLGQRATLTLPELHVDVSQLRQVAIASPLLTTFLLGSWTF